MGGGTHWVINGSWAKVAYNQAFWNGEFSVQPAISFLLLTYLFPQWLVFYFLLLCCCFTLYEYFPHQILTTEYVWVFVFCSVRLLSVLRGHSGFSSPPQLPMTSDFEGFSIPVVIHYIYFPILIIEKKPVFSLLNVEC